MIAKSAGLLLGPQRRHKGRGTLQLPSDDLEEREFRRKVAARAQERLVFRQDTSAPKLPWPPYNPYRDEVGPKYLATARIPKGSRASISSSRASLSARDWTASATYSSAFPSAGSRDGHSRAKMSITSRGSAASIVAPEVPVVQIVEAPTSITVNTANGQEWIPARAWLVLNPNESACEGQAFERFLSEAVGGGSVPEASAALLRPVPASRLHTSAAEANFQRAGRGTSLTALRHAAHALGLLLVEDEAMARAPGSTSTAVLPPPSYAAALKTVHADVRVRLRRMESIVTNTANAAEKRASIAASAGAHASSSAATPDDGCAVYVPADGTQRSVSHQALQKGIRALNEFLEFAQRQYGNPVRAWFQLDKEESMRIGEKLFVRRCEDVGFRGDIQALFRYIDGDRNGFIRLWELDAPSACILAEFKNFIDEYFGGSAREAFKYLDSNHSGRIYKNEFFSNLKKLEYEGPISRLFDLLDRERFNYVRVCDIEYLDRWQPRPYLFTKPDDQALASLKGAFAQTHNGSLFKSWRKVLDVRGHMRVAWSDFKHAHDWLSRAYTGTAISLPLPERELAGVWRALDADCSGWIALSEWDPPCFEALAEFKRWADRNHGGPLLRDGAVNAFHVLDVNSSGRLSEGEMRQITRCEDAYKGDVDTLFTSLDVNNVGKLVEEDVKFIDAWDLAWEEWECIARNRGGNVNAAAHPKKSPRLPKMA